MNDFNTTTAPEVLILTRERDFGQTLSDTFVFVKLRLGILLKSMLLFAFPLLAVGAFLFYNVFAGLLSGRMGASGGLTKSTLVGAGVGYMFFIIALFMFQLVVKCVVLAHEQKPSEPLELSDVSAQLRQHILRFVGYNTLFILVMLLALGFLGLLAAGIGALIGVAGVFLGVIALYAVIIYLMIAISCSPMVYLREGAGFMQSINRSFELIRGNWWRTFGLYMVISSIVYFAALALAVPVMIVVAALGAHSLSTDFENSFAQLFGAMFVVAMSLYMLLFSVMYVTMALHYYSLSEAIDGTGILGKIEAMEVSVAE